MKKFAFKLSAVLMSASLWVVPGVALASGSPAAALYLSPSSSSAAQGSMLSVELRVNIVNDTSHSIRARVTYPDDKIELTSVSPSAPFFEAEKSYGSGVINITYGSLSAVTGDLSFASISFKVKVSSGEAKVVIDPVIEASQHSYVAGDANGTGGNILNSVTNGTYTLTRQSGPILQPTTNPSQSAGGLTKLNQGQSTSAIAGQDSSTASPKINAPGQSSTAAGQEPGLAEPDGMGRLMEKDVLLSLILVLLAVVIISRLINKRYKKGKWIIPGVRKYRQRKRRETVADIAARVDQPHPDVAHETVAEIAARLSNPKTNAKKETVAELAARLHQKAKRKTPRHKRKNR